MEKMLEEIKLDLETIKNNAVEQKIFYAGYAQCAEQMIKIIVSKLNELKQSREKYVEEIKVEELENEAPLIVDAEPKNRRK